MGRCFRCSLHAKAAMGRFFRCSLLVIAAIGCCFRCSLTLSVTSNFRQCCPK
ncbi:hypothetical protein DPMN_118387 [Dreissena polymorpha]|uniref:Uncharacterized protein n=1 Tax=Dreissena polymorpha TaxID=45954 RepID=A0A9D4GHC3_DREPO|nr:hypothetical protein DPMN_118387 [Dreissena polymorpha]